MAPEVLTAVVAPAADDHRRADALAAQLGVPRLDALPHTGLVLVFEAAGLGLVDAGVAHARSLRVDLVHGPLGGRLRRRPGRKDPLARAVGIGHGRPPPRVLDATGGLLRDAAVLAWIGCPVVVAERHPVMAALAADGLERARRHAELADAAARIDLRPGCARAWLAEHATDIDAVVIDPMFPERRKSALVKQPMRWLRRLAGADEDALELLQQARESVRRVVVKRPRDAPPLAPEPDLQVPGGQVRFDVWLRP